MLLCNRRQEGEGEEGATREGSEEAGTFLAEHGWAQSTWRNRTSQVHKLLAFLRRGRSNALAGMRGGCSRVCGVLVIVESGGFAVGAPICVGSVQIPRKRRLLLATKKPPGVRIAGGV